MNVASSDRSAEPEGAETFAMLERKRRKRTIITPEQLMKLEELYKREQWPGRDKKEELAREIEMSTHFVNIWFQNKRSRVKKLAQEEEEIKAMKSRAHESSQCVKKFPLAPKRDLRCNNTAVNNSPVIPAPIQSMPSVLRGFPVFAITTKKNGSSPASSVLTNLPKVAVPLISQNTILATIPQTAGLQNKAKSNGTSSSSATLQTPSTSLPTNWAAKRPAPVQKFGRPPKRMKSTSDVKRPLSLSSTAYGNGNAKVPPNASQQLKAQDPVNLNSTLETASNSACKLRISASSQDAKNDVPAATLLRYMVLMMALTDLPGSITKDSSEFDLAVCATLYGVKLANGRVLTYNKQDGFHIDKMMARKNKNGKKKKKRKTGKKR